MRSISKISIAALILLILAINGLTIYWLIDGRKPREETLSEDGALFGSPYEIIVHQGEETVSISKEAPVYQEILQLNEKRADYLEYFTALDEKMKPEDSPLYLEYYYKDGYEMPIALRLQNYTVEIDRLYFFLNGAENSFMMIEAEGEKQIFGSLNMNADLIELVQGLLKEK